VNRFYLRGAIVCAVVFITIAFAIRQPAVLIFDANVVRAVVGLRTPELTLLMKIITFFGTEEFMIPASVLLTMFFFLRFRSVIMAVSVPAVMLPAWFMMKFLKQAFYRPRPDFSPLIDASGYSFPSGHAFMGVIFLGLVVFLLKSLLNNGFAQHLSSSSDKTRQDLGDKHNYLRNFKQESVAIARKLINGSMIIFILLLGFSRFYLGIHYPTDIVAGYSGGFFFYCLYKYTVQNTVDTSVEK